MSDTVSLLIAHRLGKVEAVRRLKEGFARTNGHLGAMIAMEQETLNRQPRMSQRVVKAGAIRNPPLAIGAWDDARRAMLAGGHGSSAEDAVFDYHGVFPIQMFP